MESVKVNTLLDRYFEGETSLLEEQILRTYFTGDEVAEELEEYKTLFVAFDKAQLESGSQTLNLPFEKKQAYAWKTWSTGVAAAVLIAVGVYSSSRSQETFTSTYESEEVAILKTKQALGMMSQMLAQSTTQLEVVEEFDKASSTLFK